MVERRNQLKMPKRKVQITRCTLSVNIGSNFQKILLCCADYFGVDANNESLVYVLVFQEYSTWHQSLLNQFKEYFVY